MNNSLVTLDEVKTLGDVFVKSGFFQDARDANQAIVKILYGRELGFSPIAAMTGVYIVKGKPSISANLIASRIKGSGKYDYRVKEHDATKCVIEFFQRDDEKFVSIGISTFTIDDAKKAGTQNLDKFPRNMLFARAISNGAKWFCPDAFSGVAPYTPEELGANVVQDESGDIISVTEVKEVKSEQKKKEFSIKISCPPAQFEAFCSDMEIVHIAGTPPDFHKVADALKTLGVEELTPDNIIDAKAKLKASVQHWSEDPKKRAAWFANLNANVRVNGEPLTIEQVHDALGIQHLKEFHGTGQEAFKKVKEFYK